MSKLNPERFKRYLSFLRNKGVIIRRIIAGKIYLEKVK